MKRRDFITLFTVWPFAARAQQPALGASGATVPSLTVGTGQTTISNLTIGGGGFTTGMDIHPDGTIATRVDIYGGYIANTVVGSRWQQLVTETSMPSSYTRPPSPYLNGGIQELRIAPSNSSIMFMMYVAQEGHSLTTLLKSVDKGKTWQATGFPLWAGTAQDTFRYTTGQRVAIDPNNPNIVYASTTANLYASLNGGTSFDIVSALPTVTTPGYTAMQFDPRTPNRLIVGSPGNGIYVTANSNLGISAAWTLITGSVIDPGYGKIASDGNYYVNRVAVTATLQRISPSNVLTNLTVGIASGAFMHFAIDPNNPARMVTEIYGQLCWGGPINGTPTFANQQQFSVIATDCPWHAACGNAAGGQQGAGPKAIGEMFFDPFKTVSSVSQTIGSGTKTFTDLPTSLNLAAGDLIRITHTGTATDYMLATVATYAGTTLTARVLAADLGGYLGRKYAGNAGPFSAWTITKERLWVTTGIGMYWVDGFHTSGASVYNSMNIGIEDMVCRDVIWPPGGHPVLATADRGVWHVPLQPVGATNGLTGYAPTYAINLLQGVAIDWCSDTPSTIVEVNGTSSRGKNISGGALGNWVDFTSQFSAIMIAAASPNYILAAPPGSSAINYTIDGGANWSPVLGLPTQHWDASDPQNSPAGRTVCADRVSIGTFYCYAQRTVPGLYKVVLSNGGAAVTLQHRGHLAAADNWLVQLKSVPNLGSISTTGHLFFGCGPYNDSPTPTWVSLAAVHSSHPNAGNRFMRSVDGGLNWGTIPNVLEILAFDFGAPKPGNAYPSVFIIGWVKLVGTYTFGIWRSDNFDGTLAGDANVTWTNVGTLARGWLDMPTCMAGDPNRWGRFIVGHQGSSFAIGQIDGEPDTW
jgi:hypothetical protein